MTRYGQEYFCHRAAYGQHLSTSQELVDCNKSRFTCLKKSVKYRSV